MRKTLAMFKKNLILILVICHASCLAQKKIIEEKRNDSLMKLANEQTKNLNLKPTIFGANDTTIPFGGYSYHNINGKDYSEVAAANNWSKWSLPDNMEEQYEEYYRMKKIKNVLFISLGVISIILLIMQILKILKVNKKQNLVDILGDENINFTNLETEYNSKLHSLKSLFNEKIITEDEFENKKKEMEIKFVEQKESFIENAKNNLRNEEINRKIDQLSSAYKNGILTKEELESKLKQLKKKKTSYNTGNCCTTPFF